MYFWKGWGGIATPLLAVGLPLAMLFGSEALLGAGYSKQHHWPLVAGMTGAALSIIALGWKLNWGKPPMDVTDSTSGIALRVYPAKHSIYALPIEYWGGLLLVLMCGMLALEWSK